MVFVFELVVDISSIIATSERLLWYYNFIEDINASFNETSSYSISSTDFDSVDIQWGYGAGSVTITPYDGNEIKVTEYAQRELKKNESSQIEEIK